MSTINCTPSELLAATPCVSCASSKQKLAGLVFAIAQESDYDLPTDTASLLSDSACLNCMSDSQMLDALVNLFANRYFSEQDTSNLVHDALCFSCANEKQMRAAFLYLICQNFMKPYILDSGVVQLAGGAATVASTFADSSNPILLGYLSTTNTGAPLRYQNIVNGVSFEIASTTVLDTNYVSWAIIRPS